MTQTQHNRPDAQTITMNRRRMLQLSGAAAGAAVIGSQASTPALAADAECFARIGGWNSCLQEGALRWTFQPITALGASDTPDGLTEEALRQQIDQTGRTRRSFTHTRFTSFDNLLTVLKDSAFSDAKLAVFEAINDELPQEDVQAAAEQEIEEHYSVVLDNLISAWNEEVGEFVSIAQSVHEHPDTSWRNGVLGHFWNDHPDDYDSSWNGYDHTILNEGTHTLPDGTETELYEGEIQSEIIYSTDGSTEKRTANLNLLNSGGPTTRWDYPPRIDPYPSTVENQLRTYCHRGEKGEVDGETYYTGYHGRYQEIHDAMDEVKSDIILFIDNVYGDVQQGDIDPEELLSGTEWAETVAEDSDAPMAIGELIALGIPFDQSSSQIELEDGEVLDGYLATTAEDVTLSVGEQIDPEDIDGDVMFAANPDTATVELEEDQWDDEKGVDGGEVHLLEDPDNRERLPPDPVVAVSTSHGETAMLPLDEIVEITDDDGNTVYELDYSDELEDSIAEIEDMAIYAGEDHDAQMTTRVTEQPFEIVDHADDVQEVEFERSRELHTDNNYITAEEWDQITQDKNDLISQYEESTSEGIVGGGGISWPSLPGIGELPSMVWYGILALFGITALNAASG